MPETKPDTCGVVIIPPVVFAFCLFAGIGATLAYGGGLAGVPWPLRWTSGVLVMASGGILAVWGLNLFTRLKTPYLHHKPAEKLVVTGAYRFSRNPMYVGLMSALIGLGLILGAVPMLLSAAVMFLYLDRYVIAREEAYLARKFGDAFRGYCTKVRRWI